MSISKTVTEEEWDPVFEESLRMLEAFPLADYDVIDIDGYYFGCLSKSKFNPIEQGWGACGSLYDSGVGPRQFFPKYLGTFEERYKHRNLIKGVTDPIDELNGIYLTDYYHIYGGEGSTCSYVPYLIAIALMVENRLPRRACIAGNVSDSQFIEAVDLANSVLDKPISLPDYFYRDRLFERLDALPSFEVGKLELFYNVSRFPCDKETWDFILSHYSLRSIADLCFSDPNFEDFWNRYKPESFKWSRY